MKATKEIINKIDAIKKTRIYKVVAQFPAKSYEVEFESDACTSSDRIAIDAKSAFLAKFSADTLFCADRVNIYAVS